MKYFEKTARKSWYSTNDTNDVVIPSVMMVVGAEEGAMGAIRSGTSPIKALGAGLAVGAAGLGLGYGISRVDNLYRHNKKLPEKKAELQRCERPVQMKYFEKLAQKYHPRDPEREKKDSILFGGAIGSMAGGTVAGIAAYLQNAQNREFLHKLDMPLKLKPAYKSITAIGALTGMGLGLLGGLGQYSMTEEYYLKDKPPLGRTRIPLRNYYNDKLRALDIPIPEETDTRFTSDPRYKAASVNLQMLKDKCKSAKNIDNLVADPTMKHKLHAALGNILGASRK